MTTMIRPETCEICGNTTGRCAFGARQGLCSCWRSVPCTPQISTGHLGYSWTVEGGVVEVFTTGSSICRAPLSAPLMGNGSRSGREWWPDREPFRSQWYPLTFATIEEARADLAAAN